jgi:uncharacterized protein YndB with AHSA1/START domain
MAAIVASAEIARSPDDVFAYITDPTNLPEWQESVVKVECKETAVHVGTRAQLTRRVGKREMVMTSEFVELSPPTHWALRGVDSPVRGNVDGRIEPLDNGARSRVTIEIDLHGHGIGKLLLPLVVKRKVETEMPRNMQHLKENLEQAQT